MLAKMISDCDIRRLSSITCMFCSVLQFLFKPDVAGIAAPQSTLGPGAGVGFALQKVKIYSSSSPYSTSTQSNLLLSEASVRFERE